MLSAIDVAKYFLSLQDDEEGDLISNLKLQKLLYYAQGYHLAIEGSPLFSERIKAWKHGPVVPQVYHEFKDYGSGAIPRPTDFEPASVSEADRSFLDEIYRVFGQYSAWKLAVMTHEEPPFKEAQQSCEIGHQALRDYFRQFVI